MTTIYMLAFCVSVCVYLHEFKNLCRGESVLASTHRIAAPSTAARARVGVGGAPLVMGCAGGAKRRN